ncbi:Uncharacterised protein [Mycobacterium tuberculosis]|nr:Uncharacterised protein [Mycobacterium tuberculosis]
MTLRCQPSIWEANSAELTLGKGLFFKAISVGDLSRLALMNCWTSFSNMNLFIFVFHKHLASVTILKFANNFLIYQYPVNCLLIIIANRNQFKTRSNRNLVSFVELFQQIQYIFSCVINSNRKTDRRIVHHVDLDSVLMK